MSTIKRTIEEKAKAYDEAKLRMSAAYNSNRCTIGFMNEIFPELKESEDERIREEIIDFIYDKTDTYELREKSNSWLAWLEKQGDKDKLIQELGEYKVKYTQEVLEKHLKTINKDDERLRKTTIAFLKDFAEQGYENAIECIDWLEKHEQKPIDNVEPKFKQGDIIKDKRTGCLFYVNSIEDFGYTLHYKNRTTNGCTLSFKYEDNYELIEQTLTWSKDDEEMLRRCISATCDHGYLKECDWLKSFKEKVQPKQEILEKLEEWLDEYVSDLADVDTASLICSFTNYLDGKLPKSLRPRSRKTYADMNLESLVRQVIYLYLKAGEHYNSVIKEERKEYGGSDLAIKLFDGVIDAKELSIQYVLDKLKAQKGEKA